MSPEARDHSFDELARGLASGTLSRGKALRLMGAAVVGGTLASLGLGRVAAADPPGCKRNGKTCRLDRTCCSGNCAGSTCACQSNGGTCSVGSQCCSGNCSNGLCVCPTINCGVGTLNQNTCTCECTPAAAGDFARNSDPNFQGCCPNLQSFGCVPRGTVCSPPTS